MRGARQRSPRARPSHPQDVYEAVWTSYKPGRPDPSTFDVPKECVSKIGIPSEGPLANAHLTITALLPTVGLAHATSTEADADFEAHNAAYGRQHGSEQEYQFRRGVYHRNAAYVAEWNAENERQAEEARRANKKVRGCGLAWLWWLALQRPAL